MQFLSESETDTVRLAQDIAQQVKPGDILCLRGELGTGKTVFARALIRHLSGNDDLEVPSPTFTLVQMYEALQGPVWHFDLYRITDSQDIYELGWEEALSEGIVLVEWPERLGPLMPERRIDIAFRQTDPETRTITVERHELETA